MTTTVDIARKYNKTDEEVAAALKAIQVKRVSVGARIEPAVEQQLDIYWRKQSAPGKKTKEKKAQPLGRTRTIGRTEISERPRRAISIPRPPQPSPQPETITRPPAEEIQPPAAAEPIAEQPEMQTPQQSAETVATAAAETTPATTETKPPPETTTQSAEETAAATTPSTQTPEAATVAQPLAETTAAAQPEKKSKARGGTIKMDKEALLKWERERKRREKAKKHGKPPAQSGHRFTKPAEKVARKIAIPKTITVAQLALRVSLKAAVLIGELKSQGASVDEENAAEQSLDRDTAFLIVEGLGHEPFDAPEDDIELALARGEEGEAEAERKPRPPVVTVMGHVDHGKTSLLDFIRKTKIAEGEAGGITQHINAYQTSTAKGVVTFIDTPGHELFSEIRSRGARVTDIVVLVVAADDGVRPQTIEAIHHAQAAGAKIIVAANKMDKPQADAEKVKKELSQNNVLTEDWGGEVQFVPVSALTGKGVDDLLEAISLQASVMEISAAEKAPARGVVIESRLDKGRGVVVPLIITEGILSRGDIVVCGSESGRIRTITNFAGKTVDEARPSDPVEIQGLSGIPETGSELVTVGDERKAREIAEARRDKFRAGRLASLAPDFADAEERMAADDEPRILPVIVRADVNGSREALSLALETVAGKNMQMKVIHSGVGAVNESDVHLAQASGAIVVGFNVRPDAKTRKLAEARAVKILSGRVIYDLLEEIKDLALARLGKATEEEIIGAAEVKKVFSIGKVGNIAGCVVTDGIVRADARARIMRDGAVVFEGGVDSLRHFKDAVAEVRAGDECGIGVRKFNDVKIGDVIELVRVVEVAAQL